MNMKSILKPFLIVLLIVAVATGAFFFGKRLIYARHMLQAQKAVQSGDYLEAIKLYQKELESNPRDFDLYRRLGQIYMKIGEHRKAMDIFSRGLEVKPDNYAFLVNAGILHFNEKHYETAEGYFKRLTALRKDDSQAYFYLARCLHERKKALAAEAAYLKALETGYDKARVCYNLGYLYEFELKNYEKAVENYSRCISENESYRESLQKKVDDLGLWVTGQVYEDQGDFKKAQAEYEKALARDPHSLELFTRLGRVYRKNGRYVEAERIYLRALDQFHNDYYILNNLGSLYYSIERLDDAEGCWNAAIEVKPTHPSAHFNRGVLCEKRNKPKEAEAEYLLALKYNYEKPAIYLQIAQLYDISLQDGAKALEYYQKALDAGAPDRETINQKIKRLKDAMSAVRKPDGPGTEPPKPEASKTEVPKAEPPKPEASKTEAPKAEPPKPGASRTEAPKVEPPKPEEPGSNAPGVRALETVAPEVETPKAAAPHQ